MTTSRSKRQPLVLVEWIDSCSFATQRWRDLEESRRLTPSKIQSVGWVTLNMKTHIVLCPQMDEHEHTSGDMTIPRGCIVKMTKLKGGK